MEQADELAQQKPTAEEGTDSEHAMSFLSIPLHQVEELRKALRIEGLRASSGYAFIPLIHLVSIVKERNSYNSISLMAGVWHAGGRGSTMRTTMKGGAVGRGRGSCA